jgi:hypothetical protein
MFRQNAVSRRPRHPVRLVDWEKVGRNDFALAEDIALKIEKEQPMHRV